MLQAKILLKLYNKDDDDVAWKTYLKFIFSQISMILHGRLKLFETMKFCL